MIRRTPAEFYVKYRVLAEPGKSNKELSRELVDEWVFVPDDAYFERLRKKMQVPPDFRPHDGGHQPSSSFLRQEGVWSLFHPYAGTREALALFGDVRTRMDVQTLITGGVDTDTIVKVATQRLGSTVSAAGLREFAHYFWDIKLTTRQELSEYVKGFLNDIEFGRIAALPQDEILAEQALATIGIASQLPERSDVLKRITADCVRLTTAYARDTSISPAQQMAAVKSGAETVAMLTEVLERENKDDDIREQARIFLAKTHDSPLVDLEAIGRGAVPYPVALLGTREEMEDSPEDGQRAGDEKENDGGSDAGEVGHHDE